MWKWRTNADGLIEVDQNDGAGFVAITLPGPDKLTEATEKWLDLATKYGTLNNIPPAWILAVIYSESGGNPNATNFCCGGLMALSRAVYHTTTVTETDPELSVKLGSQTLATYKNKGFDIPTVSSMYNAGPARDGSGAKQDISDPWGMVENRPAQPWTGYIEKIVRAYNWWLARLQNLELPINQPPPITETPFGISMLELLSLAAGTAAGWWIGWWWGGRRSR